METEFSVPETSAIEHKTTRSFEGSSSFIASFYKQDILTLELSSIQECKMQTALSFPSLKTFQNT